MGRRPIYDDSKNQEIIELYNDGMSISGIGKQLKMPPEVIRRKLKKNGIKLRTRTEAMRMFHKQKQEQK